ncbi:MAG: uracil phosphoribosyltransferase [Fimbriiglobus sp.]|nr:uracil phosphoribosyltransferase [Fimbriiglobus sp.]
MLFVADHPLILHKLARLRDERTPSPQFRELVYEISQYLFYEATRDVRLRSARVKTPLMTAECHELADRVGIVPVLRAGLGMANAMLDALPEASVWHVGMKRDHDTWEPKTYYRNLPTGDRVDVLMILDPMLATGGSAVETIALLKAEGNRRIKFVGLIASPEGVSRLQAAHPDVPLILAAVDEKLDENKYIVPGLGDAGDRQFGT